MAPITLSIFFFFSSITTIHGLTIKTRLIHRDSYHSPLYDAAKTIADLANESLRSSVARHEHTPSLSDNGRGGVDAELVNAIKLNIFYANFSIGYPPVPQLGVMDTGSDFLWVKCLPCSPCSPSSGGTFFDPTKSKTYMFKQVEDDKFCLAFLRSSIGVSLIGMMAQQGYNIGYDLVKERLYIKDIDCQTV
ncbi:Probable aspartic protease At2g35615 [Linum perenne]